MHEILVDLNSQARPIGQVHKSVHVPDRPVHEIPLRRAVDRLQFEKAAGGAGKAQGLACGANDGGREVVRVGLATVQGANLCSLAEAGDTFDPAGIEADDVDRPGLDDPLDAAGIPFPFAIGDADARCGPKGGIAPRIIMAERFFQPGDAVLFEGARPSDRSRDIPEILCSQIDHQILAEAHGRLNLLHELQIARLFESEMCVARLAEANLGAMKAGTGVPGNLFDHLVDAGLCAMQARDCGKSAPNGAAGGALNGVFIARIGLPSLVVTLATLIGFWGLARVLVEDRGITDFPDWFDALGQQGLIGDIPLSIVVFFVLFAFFYIVLQRSGFGRKTYLIGNSRDVAAYAGIDTARHKMILFIASGAVAALAGLLFAARVGAVANGFELDIITIVLLGGVSIFGGSGSLWGTLLAVLIVLNLRNGMALMNITGHIQTGVIGILLIASVIAPRVNLGALFAKPVGASGEGS